MQVSRTVMTATHLFARRRLLDDFRLGTAQRGLLASPQLPVQLQVARRHQNALSFDLLHQQEDIGRWS